MTSAFSMKDGSEFQLSVNVRQNGVSEKACFLELGNDVLSLLVNTLDGDALYSRSDLDMIKIEAKSSLYIYDSCSDLSCSKEDDI